MLARGVGDKLLEAGLGNLERRVRLRNQITVGEQFDVDGVVADRNLRRKRDGSAEQRRREEVTASGSSL
jgi:hypothetical protein